MFEVLLNSSLFEVFELSSQRSCWEKRFSLQKYYWSISDINEFHFQLISINAED